MDEQNLLSDLLTVTEAIRDEDYDNEVAAAVKRLSAFIEHHEEGT